MTTRQSSSVMSVMHDLGRGFFSRACLLLLELCSSLSASRAMSSSSDAAKIELLREISEGLQYGCTKLGNMEQRQCDSDCRGTDAARMCEQWSSGLHANLSEQAISFLAKAIIARGTWRATSYGWIFENKDFEWPTKTIHTSIDTMI